MSQDLFRAISMAQKAMIDNDMETFNLYSEHARLLAITLGDDAYNVTSLALYSCVDDFKRKVIEDNYRKTPRKSEYSDVHTWVRLNPDLNFIDGHKIPCGRIPDFISVENGIEYPVECKIKFTTRSVNQLRTYMASMGVDKGYAVALELATDKLPDNIKFIKVEVQ